MATEFNPAQFLQGALGAVGGIFDREAARSQANKNRDMQLMFAKKGIQMRVADAQKAGVHPLFALGASTPSYSPVSYHSDLGSVGQNIGRAVAATATVDDRLEQLTLRNMELRNQLIEGQIQKMQSDQVGPAVPHSTINMQPLISGQGDVVSSADTPLFTHDPSVALVSPPKAGVQSIKSFGYPLVRNPGKFSSAQDFENEYGEESLPAFFHNTIAYLDALARGFIRYHSPRFEARRREWHGGR